MDSAMTFTDLVPFVAVLAAAVSSLSTIAGIRMANGAAESQLRLRLSHEDGKEQKEALRSRLEELYQLVDRWAGEVVIHHITYRKVMYGQISYNQALNLTIEKDVQVDSARLFTLAELYFPESQVNFENIRAARDKAARIQNEFKEFHRNSGDTSSNHASELTKSLEEFNNAVSSYKKSLAAYARKI